MKKVGRVKNGILAAIAFIATLSACFGFKIFGSRRKNNPTIIVNSSSSENSIPIINLNPNEGAPVQENSKEYSVTRFDGLKFTVDTDKQMMYYIYEDYDKPVIAIPVIIENTGTSVTGFSVIEFYNFDPSGRELPQSHRFPEGEEFLTRLQSGAKYDTEYLIPYVGAGEYTILYDPGYEEQRKEIKLYLTM